MKNHPWLMVASLLLTPALLSAQGDSGAFGQNDSYSLHSDGSIVLNSGTLRDRIETVDHFLEDMRTHSDAEEETDWEIPNLIYSPEVEDAIVPTSIRIRGVSPLEAITLIAAAANCTLEPIYSPAKMDPTPFDQNSGERVIGYRIVTITLPVTTQSRLKNAHKPDPTAGDRPHAGLTPTTSPTAVYSLAAPEWNFPVTVGELPEAADSGYGVSFDEAGDLVPLETESSQESEESLFQTGQTFVRIYAFGSMLSEDSEERATQQDGLGQLIEDALNIAGAQSESLTLSFHPATGALIVMADDQQHQIIEQILDALREHQDTEQGQAD